MKEYDFRPATRVVFGVNSFERLGDLTAELGARRALLVTDPGILRTGYADKAVDFLRSRSIEVFVFTGVDEDPTTKDVTAGTDFARAHLPIDIIIGLGGGSSMDCAKAINFILTNGGQMEDYVGFNRAVKAMLSSIGIPTTAGTGSEAQSYALISHEHTHVKMACGDLKARFNTVILDPVLTITAPRNVTAISGMDAITHAVETFVTTARNPLSEMFSREAWRLLQANYETVLSDPSNREARAGMLLGSHYAGVAIEHSMLGAAHACANPLSARYGIAHGMAVALMLPAVITFNHSVAKDSYQLLHADLRQEIERLKSIAELPATLRSCNVSEEDLPMLAGEAALQWTGKFNPRTATETDFLALYRQIY